MRRRTGVRGLRGAGSGSAWSGRPVWGPGPGRSGRGGPLVAGAPLLACVDDSVPQEARHCYERVDGNHEQEGVIGQEGTLGQGHPDDQEHPDRRAANPSVRVGVVVGPGAAADPVSGRPVGTAGGAAGTAGMSAVSVARSA